MNYYFVIEGNGGRIKDVPFPYIQEIRPELRPVLGQVVEIKGKQYKINRTDPDTNPSDQAVTYYVELYNPTYTKQKRKPASHGGYSGMRYIDI